MAGVNPKFCKVREFSHRPHRLQGVVVGRVATRLGAQVTGFALAPETTPSHFALLPGDYESIEGDIRDLRR